ncbi:hypothetical protein T07_1620 [Trichinella nelsoni]|uniref:Uncharacterized protein n=1 Tax=Trichinella nelsoni TaxID=6336 RepID=A0A0V0SH57_9BILA|nr:hypothetical protein T07_1620 [Trichinella nelsoni]
MDGRFWNHLFMQDFESVLNSALRLHFWDVLDIVKKHLYLSLRIQISYHNPEVWQCVTSEFRCVRIMLRLIDVLVVREEKEIERGNKKFQCQMLAAVFYGRDWGALCEILFKEAMGRNVFTVIHRTVMGICKVNREKYALRI